MDTGLGSKPSADDVRFIGQLGTWLRFWRERAHLSQSELAQRCGLTRSTIARLESAGNKNAPSLMNLIHIQRALSIPSIELLLGGPTSFPSASLKAGDAAGSENQAPT
jgi:transcriptional regulator with XRE-family HTH domain